MTLQRSYVYCIARCSGERTFSDVVPIGDDGGPVHTIPQGELAAVVSGASSVDYQSTRANMLAHQRVLERLMPEFPMLPVRFGTVADHSSPTDDIRRLLDKRSQEFNTLLSGIEGKVELGLKALWRDEKSIFQEILAENDIIRRLRDLLAGKPPQATHFDRSRLGEMVKDAMDRKRTAEAAGLLAPLRQIAHRTIENQPVVDRMVLNAAFLVDEARQEEFDTAVARLDEAWGPRVSFRYVGPVPPYNFVNITINWQEL